MAMFRTTFFGYGHCNCRDNATVAFLVEWGVSLENPYFFTHASAAMALLTAMIFLLFTVEGLWFFGPPPFSP
jgi:hypothetical protein